MGMSRTKMKGTVSGTVEWDEYLLEYSASVTGDYYFQKGRMYMPNGDPGYPDEEDMDGPFLDEILEVNIMDLDGDYIPEAEADHIYNEHQEEIDKAIEDEIDNTDWYDCDWEDDEPDYPDPPEPDDWEE